MYLEKKLPFGRLVIYYIADLYTIRFVFADIDYRMLFSYFDFAGKALDIQLTSDELSVTVSDWETGLEIVEEILRRCVEYEQAKKAKLEEIDRSLTEVIGKVIKGGESHVNRKVNFNYSSRNTARKEQSCVQDGARLLEVFGLRKDNMGQETAS
ncbi:MAG: hypothetical protein QXT86_12125 [Archaeoglobaceae archaeon]